MFTGFLNSGNNSNTKGKVNLINRVLLIGIHESVTIFDAPDAESLFKFTARFHEPGAPHIHLVISIQEIKAKLKKLQENIIFLLIYLLFSF
jgi:hypothetical protein